MHYEPIDLEPIRPLVRFKRDLARETGWYWQDLSWDWEIWWRGCANWVAVDAHRGRYIKDLNPYNDGGTELLGVHHQFGRRSAIGGGCV